MKRFLVVGCGGSGGAALAYLMDQLRSDLAAVRTASAPEGLSSLPSGWQFVHIDVPLSPDSPPDGLGSVRDQGGRYIATGLPNGNFETLDHAVSQKLGAQRAISSIATWAPTNPADVKTPLSVGAGQYRAVGRMITLNKTREVLAGLQQSWDALYHVETIAEMSNLSEQAPHLGTFSPDDTPIVLMVSSMAGGAGASMALDVCRLLTLVPGLNPALMGVFMVGADVFDSLEESARSGVRPNALAMLGEIVAAQAGSARRHDVELIGALGHRAGDGVEVPFARVFPVGRFIGAERTTVGDGSPKAVYRALGRGLAALMTSDAAITPFVTYDLGNTGSPKGDRSHFGWGPERDHLPWGSFGYAALSMGRDRYAEYAAQRIARTGVDRLLEGHSQEGSSATGVQQRDVLLDSQWQHVLRSLDLPAVPADPRQGLGVAGKWFTERAMPRSVVEAAARAIADTEVAPFVPSADGVRPAQWLPALRAQLAARRSAVNAGSQQAAYGWAYTWHQALLDRTHQVIEDAIAHHGLPYADGLVQRLRHELESSLVPALRELAGRAPVDVVAVPAPIEESVGAVRGVIAAGQDLVTGVLQGVRQSAENLTFAQGALLAEQVLVSYITDVLGPLAAAVREAQRLLEQARVAEDLDLGLARLATDHYSAWPSDQDGRVPSRFSHADNEVLLTAADVFPAQYETDVRGAGSEQSGADAAGTRFEDARITVATCVVSGHWQTTGATRAPGGLVEQKAAWRSRAFATDPGTGAPLVPSSARFDVHVRPAELIGRARLFVARPDASFSRFTRVSLRAYLEKPDAALESERLGRSREMLVKFRQALMLARPLAGVNAAAVAELHGASLAYRYKFSEVPFAGLETDVAGSLRRELGQTPNVEGSSLQNFDAALASADDRITRVDIFGSYMNYSPLVFEGVLRPVAEQWGQTPLHGRGDFWRWRRARPLDAALPMGVDERRAMVTGWYLAQVMGDLRIPAAPFDQPVTIWDQDSARWLPFPHPLLTPPTTAGFAPFDWLPAVLESVLLAYTRSHEPPVMASLRPYKALRAIADSGQFAKTSGLGELSGRTALTRWLETGRSESGGVSRVPGAAEATSPAARAVLVREWVERPRNLASVHFMAPGEDGATGGGKFSVISTRKQASATPIFRDLAPDVLWACNLILSFLDVAAEPDEFGADMVF